MKRLFFKGRFIFIPLAVVAFLSLISYVIMQLWNYLMPVIFHLGVITFWQALALFVLCKILFGFGKGGHRGFGQRGGAPWMRQRMEEHFKNMTPEQKEKFKQKMNDRCSFKSGFGRHGFKNEWANFADAAEEAPKPTE
jgi:hypothetical protein